MNQEQDIKFDDISEKEALEFLSEQLLEQKQLKTINMLGGKGGFGLVLFVEEIQSPFQKYAVKVQSIINFNTGKINQNALIMCKHEADIMRNCKHKNIIEIHSDYEIGLYHLIQMNLCECSLGDWIEKNQQVQIRDSVFLYLANQILDGLQFLHNMDYVLRDLSVKNILLTTDGVIKLCDFGLAKKYDEDVQNRILYTQKAKGVLLYFPPELIEDIMNNKGQIKQTKQGDIWAFGVCLSLIGGAKIIEYANAWNNSFQIPHSPNISQSANELIKFILSKNPNERPNIVQIKNKINDLFILDQNQIEIIGENIFNLSFCQNINNQTLDYISSDQQNEIPVLTSNLSVIESNQIEQKSIYETNFSSSDKVIRMIDFQFIQANELLYKYENQLQINSENNDILVTLGFIEAEINSNINKAKQYFKKAIVNNPNDLDAYLGICECDIRIRERQSYQQHINYLKNQTKSHFQYWRLYYYLAYLYYLDIQLYDSEQCINKALELNQNSSLIISLQAQIIFKQNSNKIEEAMILFQKSDTLNQNNHPVVESRKILFEIQFIKDHAVSISKIKYLMDKGIKQFILQINLLRLYYLTKNQAQIHLYKNLLLENYSNNYLVYEYLGNFEQDKKLKIDYYSKSIEIFPENHYCLQLLEDLLDLKDFEKLIVYYKRIIEINPNDVEAYLKTGNIYKRMAKNDEKAFQFYNKALLLKPIHYETLIQIAELYYKNNQKFKALQTYFQVIEIDNCNSQFYSFIGQIESELRCHKNSIKAYEKYLQINDEDYQIKRILAYEYIENQQYLQAIQLLNQMLSKTPKDNLNQQHSECYFLLGKAEYRNKKYRQAQYYFGDCVSYNNKNNVFEAQIYHLKCQVRLQNKKNGEKLKFENQLDGFFSNFYFFGNRQYLDPILNKYLKKTTDKIHLFIMAETLFDFNIFDLSINFFKKLRRMYPKNMDIYYYLGIMENSKVLKQKYLMWYIEIFQRDDRIIKYLAENCLETTKKINYYKQLVEIDSQDIQSIEKLCDLYESQKQYNLQLELIDNLLKINKYNEYALHKIIEYLTNNSEFTNSNYYFDNYIVPLQNNVQVILKIAMKVNISDQQQFKCYQLILKIDSKNILALEKIVYYYKKVQNEEQYIKTLEDLLNVDINNNCAIKELIQLIIKQEQDENQSQNYFLSYVKYNEQSVPIILNLVKETKNLQQKLKYYKLILEIQPKNIQVLEKTAKLYKKMELIDEYENTLNLILANEHLNQFTIRELADFYYIKDIEKATYFYEQQLKFDEKNVKILKILGSIYFEKKNYSESQKMYEQVILIQPKCSDTLFKLSEVQFQIKNYSLSNENYRKAENIDSKNAIISYNMGINHYHMNDYKKSLKRLFKFISQEPNNGRAYYMIGHIYNSKQNKKEKSIAYFRKAIKCDNSLENAHYNLGQTFKELNYVYEAVNSFKQLLQLNSQYKESKQCNDYIIENEQAEIKLYKTTSVDKNCNIF